jgi:hypothetical protein
MSQCWREAEFLLPSPPISAQTSRKFPRSQRYAGLASSRGCQSIEIVASGMVTGSGRLCDIATAEPQAIAAGMRVTFAVTAGMMLLGWLSRPPAGSSGAFHSMKKELNSGQAMLNGLQIFAIGVTSEHPHAPISI